MAFIVPDALVELIIRPPRAEYEESDLLPPRFRIDGKPFKRRDLELRNARNQRLVCSHFLPERELAPAEKLPCVILCHGNSGSRAESTPAVVALLPAHITVFAIDFSGSGHSDGEYVTLSGHEVGDLAAVVTHLRGDGRTSAVGLWGRSMGAVVALRYAADDPTIAALVLDSGFAKLSLLMAELAASHVKALPTFLVPSVVGLLRAAVRKRVGVDIATIDALAAAPRCFAPALFAHATEDTFIAPHHTASLCAAYGGDKNMVKFEGTHNSPRPAFFDSSVAIFFVNTLHPPAALPSLPPTTPDTLNVRGLVGHRRSAHHHAPAFLVPQSPAEPPEFERAFVEPAAAAGASPVPTAAGVGVAVQAGVPAQSAVTALEDRLIEEAIARSLRPESVSGAGAVGGSCSGGSGHEGDAGAGDERWPGLHLSDEELESFLAQQLAALDVGSLCAAGTAANGEADPPPKVQGSAGDTDDESGDEELAEAMRLSLEPLAPQRL